ncbi:TRAP transporter substrate-binding protein [Indioceanicola profundi]|uniref:TRAP transporter substrate-binding protein n=1 Tax=Indioceanicola profundi TaxID=2220096 RepID=UPI000E6ADF55|nr:TRAP transporter substrate-binding protein [Indioceanicola profundi]
MKRREFLAAAGVGTVAAASALPAPAIAQSSPEIKWRLASSFPKSLDTIYGAGEIIANRVAEITDNKFQIRVFPGGELVPGLQVLDAVQNGTVECGHTAAYYYVGKDPTFAFDCSVPFGLNSRQQNAWQLYGGGRELLQEFYAGYNIVSFMAGNSGAQMGGWFRKEIKTPEDLKGLKMRIAGLAGQVLVKLGAVPQQIAGGDIYPALEKGTIDAAEWIGPYDDEKLGFYKVAQNYYYPGWWEPGPSFSLMINKDQWEKLPKPYQAALEAAAADANVRMSAKYDVENPQALKRLVANGAKLQPYSKEIMLAAYKATFELYDELAASNANFKKVYDGWKAFREEEYQWFRIAENYLESFSYAAAAQSRKS